MRSLLVFLILLVTTGCTLAQESDLARKLRELPGVVNITPFKRDTLFSEEYEIELRQSLDHSNPDGRSFTQHIFLSHRDADGPTVLETEGYAARAGRARELTRYLKGNQIVVEHRFCGKSAPDSLDWRCLTLKQSADDLHTIATLLKGIYRGRWISSGTSKGGQTTLLYRYYYPDDVDASVAYVAPVNLAQEDPRLLAFFRTVGTPECRQRIKEYQRALFRSADRILTMVDSLISRNKMILPLGGRLTFEYMVLEYPFAHWQYGIPCESVPDAGAPAETLFSHLNRVVGFSLYNEQGMKYFQPFQYQAYTELGYYGYDITDFKEYLHAMNEPTNRVFAPANVELKYNCATMQSINKWLQREGNNIIYIYGENDPWGATGIELNGMTNALKMVKKGGAHGSRISTLSPEQQELVLSTLEKWLHLTIPR